MDIDEFHDFVIDVGLETSLKTNVGGAQNAAQTVGLDSRRSCYSLMRPPGRPHAAECSLSGGVYLRGMHCRVARPDPSQNGPGGQRRSGP